MKINQKKAAEFNKYFLFRLKYLSKQYPNDFELGKQIRNISNEL